MAEETNIAEVAETSETAEIADTAETAAVTETAASPEQPASAPARNLRKERVGIVVSNKMQKTAVVKIEESVKHSKYSKILKRSIKFKVHDEKNECDIGDRVLIMETRPLSRDKRWRLVKILEKVK